MRRPLLLAVLGFGVFAGFGSGFAHMRHMRQHCEGRWEQDRFSDHRWDRFERRDDRREEPRNVAAPATIVMPQAAAAPAPAPQIFVIMPGAQAPAQVVAVPVAAAPQPSTP